jgi:hypothetical protein
MDSDYYAVEDEGHFFKVRRAQIYQGPGPRASMRPRLHSAW